MATRGDHTATGETCATLALSELAQTSTEDFQQGNGQTKSQYISTLPVTPTYKDEKQVRVSVYWYTRSLKKNRVKRKLLDSRMVSIYGEEWLEFNVKSAARVWRESGKNFGLSIQVEDEDNQVLPAVKYFSFMDCSNEAWRGGCGTCARVLKFNRAEATARPIPGFLVNAARDYILENTRNETNTRRSNTIYLDSLMFPMIDLFTIEMPEHEMVDAALLYQTRYSLTQHMTNINSFSPHSPIVKINSDDPTIDQIDPPQGEKLINYVVNVEENEHKENVRLKKPNNHNLQEQQLHEINDYQYSKEHFNVSSTVKVLTPKIRHPRHSLKVPHKHRLLSLSFRIDQKQARNKENEELLTERYLCCNYNGYQVKNQTFIPKILFSFNPYLNASVSQKKIDR
uniref:TGF-beta propeptide domain-containing protein n=1 Tax=Timema bartmani TaxID=61472 RepID=A0A7R9FAE3_9NEOP|nr:unnamed protein product [Timema bartmani]